MLLFLFLSHFCMSETFHGYIASTKDSLIVFEACRRGLLPRVTRRLQEKERHLVQSGAVFCFDENESGKQAYGVFLFGLGPLRQWHVYIKYLLYVGIKRWTDGLVWSPSRILGNFLVYRELDKRANPIDGYGDNTSGLQNLSDRQRERALVGSLTDSYRFKKDGLIKKSMSLVVDGVQQHLVSYYRKNDVLEDKLRRPSTVPVLALLDISPDLIFGQNFRIPVHVDGKTLTSRYSPSSLTREENIAAILDRSVIRQRRKQAARTKQLELQQQQQKNLFQLSSDTTTTTATECICGANQAGSSSSSSSTTATISSSSPSTNNPFNTSSIPSTTVVHHQAVTAIPPALEYNSKSHSFVSVHKGYTVDVIFHRSLCRFVVLLFVITLAVVVVIIVIVILRCWLICVRHVRPCRRNKRLSFRSAGTESASAFILVHIPAPHQPRSYAPADDCDYKRFHVRSKLSFGLWMERL